MVTSNPLLKREASFAGTIDAPMTLNGTVNKTGILLLICIATAAYAWENPTALAHLIFLPLIGAFILSMVAIFKPASSPYVAPVYAALEGLVLGVISYFFNARYHGIAAEAVLATFSVLGVFLFLYATRIVRVTRGFAVAVIAATAGVALVYLIDIVMGMFGHPLGIINGAGTMGLLCSVLICGIAAFNLFLDFAAIEGFINGGAPKYMEWYAGISLMITLVWLYLEILRLLSKLQDRR